MSKYIRKCQVVFNSKGYDLTISGLRIAFRVVPSIDVQPDEAVIDVYNLKNKTISDIRKDFTSVKLMIGYDHLSEIYNGEIRTIRSRRSGTDIITTITAGAGDKQLRTSSINTTDRTKTLLSQIEKIRLSMGLTKGDYVGISGAPKSKRAVVLSGSSFNAMNMLARKYNFHWFISLGRLYVVKDTGFLKTEVLLTSESGLIGLPEKAEEGLVSFRALLDVNIKCGWSVAINVDNDIFENGRFRVNRMVNVGDTHSNDWYSIVSEAVRISFDDKVLLTNDELNNRI